MGEPRDRDAELHRLGRRDGRADVARPSRRSGLHVQWQQVEDARANVLGIREGSGGAPSLMFNGHMDTSYSGREPWLPPRPRLPARRLRPGRAALRARHLEHEGRARLLRRGAARARRRGAAWRRHDRRGLRRDREDAVRRRAGRRVPRLRGGLPLPRHARRRRRHVRARRADRGQGRARPLRLAVAAHLGARATSSIRPSAKGGATATRSCACARCSTQSSGGSRSGRATRRTRTAARARSSTSARSPAASAGASRGRLIGPTCSSTCACRRRSR